MVAIKGYQAYSTCNEIFQKAVLFSFCIFVCRWTTKVSLKTRDFALMKYHFCKTSWSTSGSSMWKQHQWESIISHNWIMYSSNQRRDDSTVVVFKVDSHNGK